MDRPLFLRDFYPLHFLEFLNAALHLLGFGGGVAEAVDKNFQLLNAFTLIAKRRLKLLEALLFLPQKLLIVAGVEMNAFIPDFGNLVDRHVEEVAVVGDQNKGVGIVR